MVPLGRWVTYRFLLAMKFLGGYVHRSTLPQSRFRSTAPSEREPGNVPIQPGTCETVGLAGDFHRPYEGSECFTFHHSLGDTPSCFGGSRLVFGRTWLCLLLW